MSINTFEELSKDYSLIRLYGKNPWQKGWTKFCHEKRNFDEINFQPGDNAGICTGPASDLLVVDVDDETLFQKICEEKGWNVPETRTHRTGGGGRHLLYRYPKDGKRYGNRVFKEDGFDIRGDGGQIVSPGSIHPETGQPYTVERDVPIADAPEWLLGLSLNEAKEKKQKKKVPTNSGLTTSASNPVEVLKGVSEGERDDALFRYASRLFAKGMSREEAETLVCEAAERCIPPFPRAEALKKVASAYSYPDEFPLTDLGNSERLLAIFGTQFRYCSEWKRSLFWAGNMWRLDDKDGSKMMDFGKRTIRSIYGEAARCEDDGKRREMVQHAKRSESIGAINATVRLARSGRNIPVSPDEFDRDDWLFNVKNGTINLRTGELLPHNPDHLITKISEIEFDPKAECPLWISFLTRVMGGSSEMLGFLKRAAGYCLTGDVGEQCIFFLYGKGANGKTTLLETLSALIGDYGKQAASATFLLKMNDSVRDDIADLRGARFVSTVEVEANKKLAEGLLKQVSGGDRIRARFLYGDYFEFKPTFKVFIAANHKPNMNGNDDAIWRRIKLIPFEVTIPERDRDPALMGKLRAELPGILRWAVEGCLEWKKQGLGFPQKVNAATAAYRAEMDRIADFITDCCKVGPTEKVRLLEMQEAYKAWCMDIGEEPLDPKLLPKELADRGFIKKRGSLGQTYWHGIGLTVVPAGSVAWMGLAPASATGAPISGA